MKIKATPIKGKDLQPGDLFSSDGPFYWNYAMDNPGVGERVYIRTNTPAHPDNPLDDSEYEVYKIEILK